MMTVTSKPAACKALRADSRPDPGPFTQISTDLTPCSMAFRAAEPAVTWAAKGVLLREPLNPSLPALAQAKVFPDTSVMVTTVLLKLARMWAIPLGIFFFLFLFPVPFFAIS